MPRQPQFPPPIYPLKHRDGAPIFTRVWQGGRPTDIRLGLAGSEEARVKYARIVQRLASGLPPTDSPRNVAPGEAVTVEGLCARFWAQRAEPRYRDDELEAYRQSLRPLRVLFGSLPACEPMARPVKAKTTAWEKAVLDRAGI